MLGSVFSPALPGKVRAAVTQHTPLGSISAPRSLVCTRSYLLSDSRDSQREFLVHVTLQLLHQAVPSFVSPGSSDGLIYNLSPPSATTPLSSNQLLLIQSQYTPQTPNNVNGAVASGRRCWCWAACQWEEARPEEEL